MYLFIVYIPMYCIYVPYMCYILRMHLCTPYCTFVPCMYLVQVATRLLLPKPSAGNITVTNLIKFTSFNLLFSVSVLFIFLFNYFFTSSPLNIRHMVGLQQNAMLVCLLFTNKEVS